MFTLQLYLQKKHNTIIRLKLLLALQRAVFWFIRLLFFATIPIH